MAAEDERIRMIGVMAREAGILDDPAWLSRLSEPVPLWFVLEMMLKWIDRYDPQDGPFD